MRSLSRLVGASVTLLAAAGCQLIFGVGDPVLLQGTGGTGGATTSSSGSGTAGSGGAMVCAPEQEDPCYEGPIGTEGKGLCQGGTRTCEKDGSGWGTCTGQVVPKSETCGSTEDEDCDGVDCVVWAKGYGDATQSQEVNAIALAPADDSVIIVGRFEGTIQFGAETLTPDTTYGNAFVARIATDGTPIWARALGLQHGAAAVADVDGNVYVAGRCDHESGCSQMTSMGAKTLGKGQSIVKVDKDGGVDWARFYGNTAPVGQSNGLGITSLAIASDGDLIAAGYFSDPVDFGDGLVQPPGPGQACYIAKLGSADGAGSKAATGAHWSHVFAPHGTTYWSSSVGPRVGVDQKGNVFLGTTYTGAVQLGGATLTSSGGNDIAVVVYDAMGGVVYPAQSIGGTGDQVLDALAVDPYGTVVIAGVTVGTFEMPGTNTTLTAASPLGDGFVMRMLPGNLSFAYWGMTWGTNGEAVDVGIDANGDVRVLGWFSGTFDRGAGILEAGTYQMMVLGKLAQIDGAMTWNRGWINPGFTLVARLAVGPEGGSFVGGTALGGPFDLGSGALFQPSDVAQAWIGRFGL